MGTKRRITDYDDEGPSCSHAVPAKRQELDLEVYTSNAPRLSVASTESTCRKRFSQSSQLSVTRSGHPIVRCGKILRLHLVNFMCHENFVMDLHPRINFLVGSNGSGKSAVLAAIMLVLGAKARETNRSTCMKNFIRMNQSSAKIEITLSNDGPEAYEPSKYGSRITVTRTISQTSSSYSIKNATGQVISRKLDDLHNLLMYHNIQVDNPIFVLNQDASREMLKELEPKVNYKLFLKATQIESVNAKLSECLHMNRDHGERLETYKKNVEKNKTELEDLKNKLMQLISLEEVKNVVKKMEIEYIWLKVADKEEELQRLNDIIAEMKLKLDKMQELVTGKDDMSIKLTQSIRCIESQIDSQNQEYSTKNLVYMQKKKDLRNFDDQCTQIERDIVSLKERMQFLETDIKDLYESIEKRSNNTEIDAIRARNEAELQALNTQRTDNAAVMETTRQDLKIYTNDYIHIEEQLKNVQDQNETYNFKIRSVEQEIVTMQNTSKDQLSVYGPYVTPFLDEIKKVVSSGLFTSTPRGPIGRYIEVPNAQYRNVIEFQLQPILGAFIVCNTKDRLTLLNILKKQQFTNYRPKIITTSFYNYVFDVTNGCVIPPKRGARQMMSEISCKDPVVMNCLIDQIHIETILIADTKEIAEHLTSDSQNVPRNLKKVIVVNPTVEYFPDPHYRMYHLPVVDARFIQVNVKDRIEQLKKNNEALQHEIKKNEKSSKDIKKKSTTSKKRVEIQRGRLQELEVIKKKLEQRITELEQYEYPKPNELNILKEDLEVLENKKHKYNIELQKKIAVLSERTKERDVFGSEIKELVQNMRAVQQKIGEYNNNCKEKRVQLQALNQNYHIKKQQLSEVEHLIADTENEAKIISDQLAEATLEANALGERCVSQYTKEELLTKINELKAKLKRGSQIQEDPEKLKKIIKVKQLNLLLNNNKYQNLEQTHTQLNNSLSVRFHFLREFRNHMALIISFTFTSCCKLRNYVGDIKMAHKEKTLTILVTPHDQNLGTAVSSTRSLSGGERSFATIAFLLSLWACVDHPFYILDEYDVFTDEVNREFITRMLIDEGKSHMERQYIFLTPQALELEEDESLQIHKFAVPKRK